MRAYAEMLADAKATPEASGVETRRAALAEMGGTESVKQAVREHRAGSEIEKLWQDVRYEFRQLLRSPGFSLTALLTLTMAIGANVIVFGVTNAVLLNPLPVPQPKGTVLLVRSQRPASGMIPAVRRAIAGVDAAVPVLRIDAWQNALSIETLPERAATIALGVLGLFAVLLALTGIFGLANYTVSRRMREFGIRVAMGARHADVLRVALGRVCVLLIAGSAAGLALSAAGGK